MANRNYDNSASNISAALQREILRSIKAPTLSDLLNTLDVLVDDVKAIKQHLMPPTGTLITGTEAERIYRGLR